MRSPPFGFRLRTGAKQIAGHQVCVAGHVVTAASNFMDATHLRDVTNWTRRADGVRAAVHVNSCVDLTVNPCARNVRAHSCCVDLRRE